MTGETASPRPEPTTVRVIAEPVRYCGRCGAPYEPGWNWCHPCGRLPRPMIVPPTARAAVRPVASLVWPLALYFALLAGNLLALLPELAGIHSPVLDLAVVAVADALIVLVWACATRSDILPLLRKAPMPQWFLLAAGSGLVTLPLALFSMFALSTMLSLHDLHDPLEEVFGQIRLRWSILLICVQPAIIEELAFRGVILSAMRRLVHPAPAVIITAAMFMALHLAPLAFPHLFLLGLLLGWLTVRTGSIYPAMLLHFTHNLLATLHTAWWPQWPG